MPYRVPDNRPNDHVDKGVQPCTDNREAMSRNEAALQGQAEVHEEQHKDSGEERRAWLGSEAEDSFKELQRERSRRQ